MLARGDKDGAPSELRWGSCQHLNSPYLAVGTFFGQLGSDEITIPLAVSLRIERYQFCFPAAMSPVGTFRTWRDVRLESAFGGKAEVEFRSRPRTITTRYHAVAVVQLGKLTEARETILRALEANPDAAFSMIGRYFRHQWVHDLYIGARHPVILPELASRVASP